MNLRELRESENLTLVQAGKRLKVAYTTWLRWEAKQIDISASTFVKIAKAFKVQVIINPNGQIEYRKI